MRIRPLMLALLAGALPLSAFAASQNLLPPQSGDLVPTLVHARTAAAAAAVSSKLAPAAPQVHAERQPIQGPLLIEISTVSASLEQMRMA